MKEEADFEIRPKLSEYFGEEEEVVVVDPDLSALFCILGDNFGKFFVHFAVDGHPVDIESGTSSHVVKHGPKGRISVSFVVAVEFGLCEHDGFDTDFVE